MAERGWCIGAILKLLQVSDITDVKLLGLRVFESCRNAKNSNPSQLRSFFHMKAGGFS